MHFVGARIGAVDLVDDDDRLQAQFQGFARHEFGLGQRAFGSVHQNDNAVDHRQDAFDFAAEIRVAGGVDDIDAGVFPHQGGDLRKDRDAALFFEVVGVHDALGDFFVRAELARLAEKNVNEGCFPMVDVCDDGNVAKLVGHIFPP